MPKGRPGGNPDITQWSFEAPEDRESYTEKLQLRVTLSMHKAIRQQEEWQDFVRDAIAEKLAREGNSDLQS